MAGLKSHQVKASTLVEVLVAMVIIMIVFAMATAIYTNVVSSSPSFSAQEIKFKSEGVISQSITDQNWNDEVIESDSLTFKKTVTPYLDDPELLLIRVTAARQGKEAGEFRRIVKGHKHED